MSVKINMVKKILK